MSEKLNFVKLDDDIFAKIKMTKPEAADWSAIFTRDQRIVPVMRNQITVYIDDEGFVCATISVALAGMDINDEDLERLKQDGKLTFYND